jgi:hypothetical protein
MGRRTRRALAVACWSAAAAVAAGAQEAPIADNSFLVEEAYNQERGVVQHVSTFERAREGGGWLSTFTQEWPAPGQRHQLSATLASAELEGESGWADAALHYRYQLRGAGDDPLAIAPRVSLLLPVGDSARGHGAGAPGLQVNLPVSARLGASLVGHWNAGATWIPDAESPDGAEVDSSAITLAQGLVWLARPRLNLLLETVWSSSETPVAGGGVAREESLVIAPGVRFALDLANGLQIVPGLAVPIGVGPSSGERSLFLYLSFEHPFGG